MAASGHLNRPRRIRRPSGIRATQRAVAAPLLVVVALLGLATTACGGDDSADPTTTAAASGEDANSPDESDPGTDPPPDDAGDTTAAGGTSGEMTIETDTGESWTLEQYRCLYQPDNEGRFVQLWTAGGTLPNGGEFVVQETTSPDGTPGETLIDGGLFDDDSDVDYVVIEGEAESDGTTMTMTLGMHDTPIRAVGDPIDLTAIVTCEL